MAKPSATAVQEPWSFPFCPEPPGWELDWPAIRNAFAWMRSMADCPQDPAWHAEGDVLLHTRMVCEALDDDGFVARAFSGAAFRAFRGGPAARRR